jgi:DNA-binding XRE family transcriptional regulator
MPLSTTEKPVPRSPRAREQRSTQGLDPMRAMVDALGVPFARALGAFVRELARPSDTPNAALQALLGAEPGWVRSVDDLAPPLRDELNRVFDRSEALRKAGKLKMVEFTADSPAQAAARRLRQVAKERGVSQKDLAAKLKVTPGVINRVFKAPDRSKVATLRKVAAALGVELHEIV